MPLVCPWIRTNIELAELVCTTSVGAGLTPDKLVIVCGARDPGEGITDLFTAICEPSPSAALICAALVEAFLDPVGGRKIA